MWRGCSTSRRMPALSGKELGTLPSCLSVGSERVSAPCRFGFTLPPGAERLPALCFSAQLRDCWGHGRRGGAAGQYVSAGLSISASVAAAASACAGCREWGWHFAVLQARPHPALRRAFHAWWGRSRALPRIAATRSGQWPSPPTRCVCSCRRWAQTGRSCTALAATPRSPSRQDSGRSAASRVAAMRVWWRGLKKGKKVPNNFLTTILSLRPLWRPISPLGICVYIICVNKQQCVGVCRSCRERDANNYITPAGCLACCLACVGSSSGAIQMASRH